MQMHRLILSYPVCIMSDDPAAVLKLTDISQHQLRHVIMSSVIISGSLVNNGGNRQTDINVKLIDFVHFVICKP